MGKPNKITLQELKRSSPEAYEYLDAGDVLRWLEQANQFIRKFLSAEEIIKYKELRNEK